MRNRSLWTISFRESQTEESSNRHIAARWSQDHQHPQERSQQGAQYQVDSALPGLIQPESTDVEYVLKLNNEGLVSYPTGTYDYFKAKARSHKLLENECITSCRHWWEKSVYQIRWDKYEVYLAVATTGTNGSMTSPDGTCLHQTWARLLDTSCH